MSKFAYALKRRRKAAGMSQVQLAAACDVTNKRLSAFEREDRLPTIDEHSRLCEVLGWLPPPSPFEAPTHNEEWRNHFRDRRDWHPPRERSLHSRLKSAREAYPALMSRLAWMTQRHEAWLLNAVLGSSLETLVFLLLLEARASELSVRLLSWGFRQLPVIDPQTGEGRGDYAFPALGLALSRGWAVLIPQVGLLASGPLVADILVGLSAGRRRFWLLIEVDGGGHRVGSDRSRERRHGMEVIRFSEAEILSEGFVALLVQRLEARLEKLLAA